MLNHMVEEVIDLDDVFHALANRARRQMVGRLRSADLTVGELAEPLSMSLAAASKHIKVLERAGLVHQSVVGRTHVCRLDRDRLTPASDWLDATRRQWEGRLDVLERLFVEGSVPAADVEEDPS
jgi:DNA-binding transcriptional ArsR family regulator